MNLLVVGCLGLVCLCVAALLIRVLVRRPWLSPWLLVPIFATSAEIQLRIGGSAGLIKDALVALVVLTTVWHVLRDRQLLSRLAPWRGPLSALALVAALYVANPLGQHGLDWLFSVRLVLEASALLVVGLLAPDAARTRLHLVRVVAVVTPLEAAFAWLQHLVGEDTLVYSWGYQFGAQVRQTSGGGLRTSGTFAEPFSLTALAVVALVLGLFLARDWIAAVLIGSAVVIVAATSVRTALVQMAVVALLWAIHRDWKVQAFAVAVTVAAAGIVAGAIITTTSTTGIHKPLLLGLNGRTTVWRQAIRGPLSLVGGNGVAAVGSGSDRSSQGLVTQAATYNAVTSPTAAAPVQSTFLDSAYAQVQSDVGILGTVALALWLVGMLLVLSRGRRRGGRLLVDGADAPVRRRMAPAEFAALALLVAGAIDWVGRTTLFAFPTGFVVMLSIGILGSALTDPESDRAGSP